MTQKLMVSKLYLTESFPTHPLSLCPSAMFISFFHGSWGTSRLSHRSYETRAVPIVQGNGRHTARTTPLYPHPPHSNPHRLSSPSASFDMWHPPTWGVFCNVRFLLRCLLLAPNLHLPGLQTNPPAPALSSSPCIPPLWNLIRSQVSEWSPPPLPYSLPLLSSIPHCGGFFLSDPLTD